MVANFNFKPVAYFGMLAFLILLKEVVFFHVVVFCL